MMIDKCLVEMVPDSKKYIAGNVLPGGKYR